MPADLDKAARVLITTALKQLGLLRLAILAGLVMAVFAATTASPVAAGSGDRTLWLRHTHTGESARFTFRKNGQYDQSVLNDMNRFLADWRNKRPTRMDPQLFDLIWEIYQEVGAREPVNIVSAYRSPETNALLRKASTGVAENSQHMRGHAMDIFIPGVKLARLREAAMRRQVGGVGFYPTSASPFVHVDTGNVRAWPRMTRAQLQRLFPDGRTLHLPTDGRPLSESGRAYALAEWNKCRTVPCNGRPAVPADTVVVAAVEQNAATPSAAPVPATRPQSFATGPEPTQRVVATLAVTAPIPLYRPGREAGALVAALPGALDPEMLAAPVPATKSARLRLATAASPGTVPDSGGVLSAYAPQAGDLLGKLIESEPAAEIVSPVETPDAATTFLEATFSNLPDTPSPMAMALQASLRADTRARTLALRSDLDFVAPDLDHVNETLVFPAPITAGFWADMTEAEGYLDKTTELGAGTVRMHVVGADAPVPAYDRFIGGTPVAVADL